MVLKEYLIKKVGNYGQISPLPDGKLGRALYEHLMYEKKGIEFMPNPLWGIVRFYNKKKGLFPWGLYRRVHNIFEQYSSKVEQISLKTIVGDSDIPLMVDSVVLRDYQLEAVESLIANGGGILSIPTGGGKTITAIEFMKHSKKKCLVIVTTLDIKRMWEEEVKDCPNITIINYQNKTAKQIVKNYDIVLFDECHHVSCKTIYGIAMNAKTDSFLVGLSATPYREDGEDMRLEAALGVVVYDIDRKKLIEEGHLCDAIIKYKSFDYPVEKHITYADEYKRYIVDNVERNEWICLKALEESRDGKKVLILVHHIEHGEKIMDLLDCSRSVFLHGGVKDRSVDLESYDIVVASTIFNEGVNLPSLDVLILAGAGKSEIVLTQRVGRVLRISHNKQKAIIYDFVDSGLYLFSHYKKRRALFEKEFEVIDL